MYYTTWCGRSLVRATAETKADVTIQPFGKMRDGTPVELFTLIDGPMEARIITYGGILVSLTVPDRHGRSEDVVLGYDNLNRHVSERITCVLHVSHLVSFLTLVSWSYPKA
jgi:aldose 1-epimerase